MIKFLFVGKCAFILGTHICFGQLPKPSYGSIQQYANFPSKYVPARRVDVWLPPNYDSTEKYAVLYMHDGKALFDSSLMWNKQEWGVDETMQLMQYNKGNKNNIVVGIWNSGATRRAEYFPQKVFELLTPMQQQAFSQAKAGSQLMLVGNMQADNYLKFIVKELKPFIDSTYYVHTDIANTFIAGSSYGALISLYAICQYPKVFGGAACLSTHWPGTYSLHNNPIPEAVLAYLKINLPTPSHHKIYFDYGTITLDSLYASTQKKVNKLMKAKGYTANSWITKVFVGADHTEKSWAARLNIPFHFLLATKAVK